MNEFNFYLIFSRELGPVSVTGGKTRSRVHPDKDKEVQQLAAGGLSVTGCLSDFSLYIFHPYGAAKKSGN